MTPKITADDKCSRCRSSICCTYVTETLGPMRSKSDFEHLLWQVSHAGVEAYQDEEGWFLILQGRCQHLQSDGRCGIYATRPQTCRDYANDWCELDEPASNHFKHHFCDYHELLSYCRKRFKRWNG